MKWFISKKQYKILIISLHMNKGKKIKQIYASSKILQKDMTHADNAYF